MARSSSAVARLVALVLLAGAGSALEGLTTVWSLPLGLGPVANTQVQPFATDDTTIYAANTRGVLFAVDAATSNLLWSAPGNNEVSEILLFPEVPDKLYVVSYGYSQQVSVQAMRRSDGMTLGALSNLTGGQTMTAHIAVSGENLAVWHNNGVMVTDQVLRPIWRRDAGPNLTYYYSHVGANSHVVATISHEEADFPLTNAVSFDARTGEVVCNLTNITDAMNEDDGLPLALTPRNFSVAALQDNLNPFGVAVSWRLLDFGSCKVIRTYGINDKAIGFSAVPFLIYPGTDNELLINLNLTNTSWIISASPVSDRFVTGFLWSSTLTDVDGLAPVDQAPLLSRLPFQRDAVAVWCTTLLTAFNATSGKKLWSFPHRLPTGPASQGEFVFPLGSGRLLVPNIDGYIIVNILTGAVETVAEGNAVFSEGAIASFMNATSQTPFTVYIAQDGSLVATH